MKSFDSFVSDTIMLIRNDDEEIKCNYTKIYDLSKIDSKEHISLEEKKNILIAIKKILLSTYLYFYSTFFVHIIMKLLKTTLFFLFFIIIYSPIYRAYFYSPEDINNPPQECTFWEKIICFYYLFILGYNSFRNKEFSRMDEVKKIMNFYAQTIVIERNQSNEEKNNLMFFNDVNFNIYIIKKSAFNCQIKYPNINEDTIKKGIKNKFYQYVINYPNTNDYKWDRKIINEKENEIVNDIIYFTKLATNELFIKTSPSLVLYLIFDVLFCNFLLKGNYRKSLIFRICIFILNMIFSKLKSKVYKNILLNKQKILSQKYIPDGYFIVLTPIIIQIFKLNDDYVDNSLNIDEIYKRISKDIDNLNTKMFQ